MNKLTTTFIKLIVITLVLTFMVRCIAVKKSTYSQSNCPVNSQHYWIEVDEKYNNCLLPSRDFYCEKWIGGGNYGYYPEYLYKAYNSSRKDTVKSIIALHTSNLNGISNFSNLEYLMIYEIDSLPEEISKLKKLKVLYIVNYYADKISKHISQLPTIEILSINGARNLKDFDENLYNLSNLRELYISNTRTKFETVIDFGRFRKLERLILNDNTEPLINKTIVKCKNIEYISSLKINSYFEYLKKLEVLSVEHVDSKYELVCLPKIKNLEELFIQNYSLDGIDESIINIPNLRNLDIDFSYSNTLVCESKIHFKKLRYLRLSSYNLDCFPYFNMPNIEYINLGNRGVNKLEKFDYSRINDYKDLKVLDIAGSGFKDFLIEKDSMRVELFNPWN